MTKFGMETRVCFRGSAECIAQFVSDAEFLVVHEPVFQLLLSISYDCYGRVSLKSVSANSQCSYAHFCKVRIAAMLFTLG